MRYRLCGKSPASAAHAGFPHFRFCEDIAASVATHLRDPTAVPGILSDPFVVSTSVGEPIITRRVYRGCTVIACSHQKSADLVEVEIMDFDAIMGMDSLTAFCATVDCRAKAARFHFLGENSTCRIEGVKGAVKRFIGERFLQDVYWWDNMKKNIDAFVTQCPSCQQVNVEHQKPEGLIQTIEIPMRKWEAISMEFFMGLPCSHLKFASIWMIVDRLTKLSHFMPVGSTYTAKDYAKLYIKEIVRLHKVPISIISDCGA
uniref:Integrase zinc-binding domain-containing protein n=1 Tax=Nicotiana tabacum TaxID=4097 RepID=A0A1S4D6J3_TOBAC|nr:PREDICTED: uncharacterized protein LOC107826590 [Nicotiana tabacum]